ncbi:hypothetical protein Nepgr_033864 [Nepenthes gracilis]|uniref:Uncharacterized protein n=1 Tax=Nepenthes gracilis TaxID=150966 RepID=A0AAD3TLX3_NEPGR|nr:hypothetical protein Nepgr_033864 [Nepenthes gracilis]
MLTWPACLPDSGFFSSFCAIVALQQFAFCSLIWKDFGTFSFVPVFFGNELEDGVQCAAPDRIMVLFGLFSILRTVTGLFPCGWLADRRRLHQIADRLWGRFSLKWPFSFDTCGRPHLPPETDLAAGGVPVCWLLLVLPVDETCELLILVLEHYGAKRCCRASICAGPSLLAVARFSGCLVFQFQHAAALLE